MDYLNKLNPQQREAATHKDGPLLILAGAGSGKTSTMTHRIAYLIQEEGIDPYHLLAVTFTNKAAKEMRDRVESLVGKGVGMWILTFHSMCLRILRRYAERLGYTNDFVIYDPTDQKVVMKTCVKELNVDEKQFPAPYLLKIIGDCKEKAITPSEYLELNGSEYRNRVVCQLYQAYENVLRKNNAMDFDDLILNTVRIFEQEKDVLIQYQNRFQYIMVDEYQDTNYTQYRVVKLLAKAHENLCVVGDDDQCIYQWRGADIKNILDFEKDFKNTKVIKLEQNYRSCSNILDGAHSVIANNKGRKHKKLWTVKDKGEKIKYYQGQDEKEEARYIAQEIERLHSGERQYRDFAILYRTNAQSRTFEEALLSKDLPYRVLGGIKYYDRKEIKDVMAYMRLVQNPSDDLSFARIINEPKRGIGNKTIDKLRALAAVRDESMFASLTDEEILSGLPTKAVSGVRNMVEAICLYAQEKDQLKVSDIYDGLLMKTGYLKSLEIQNTVEADSRIENLLEFKSVIYEYEEENPMLTLAEFMEKVALIADVDNHDADENAVVLMTMHSAKGLEFPIVFMPGMEDGLFPGWRALEKPQGVEEERRLCYVGMTRAKEKLYLTSARMRTLYGKTDYTRESQFLKELDETFVEGEPTKKRKPTRQSREFSGRNDGAGGEIFRPFDQLKYIRQNPAVAKAPGAAAASGMGKEKAFAPGDRIRHNKFGEGLVIDGDAKTVTIMFDTVGRKKLAIDIAPLKKID